MLSSLEEEQTLTSKDTLHTGRAAQSSSAQAGAAGYCEHREHEDRTREAKRLKGRDERGFPFRERKGGEKKKAATKIKSNLLN